MSHGSVEKCEPNMTPMLDLVLQLVMFFMLCANFVMDDVNPTVKLPTALSARPMDKSVTDAHFLNIDVNGHVVFGRDEKTTKWRNRVQVAQGMKRRMEVDQVKIDNEKKAGRPEKPVPLVVLRAHEECKWEQVNQVLLGCREAGYLNIQLRAIVGNTPK